MRIIGIGGLWSNNNPLWNTVGPAFKSEFNDAAFIVEEENYLRLHEFDRGRKFADAIVERHDNGEELLLVAHSYGGLVACSIANRFEKSRVIGIASIFVPHIVLSFLMPCRHGEPRAPIVSFGGVYDYVVPLFLTRHPQSVAHIPVRSNHWEDVAENPSLAELIARETKRHLFPDPEAT